MELVLSIPQDSTTGITNNIPTRLSNVYWSHDVCSIAKLTVWLPCRFTNKNEFSLLNNSKRSARTCSTRIL